MIGVMLSVSLLGDVPIALMVAILNRNCVLNLLWLFLGSRFKIYFRKQLS